MCAMCRPRLRPKIDGPAKYTSPVLFLYMTALGQQRTLADLIFMSGSPPTTDIKRQKADIGNPMSVSPPKADIISTPVNVR